MSFDNACVCAFPISSLEIGNVSFPLYVTTQRRLAFGNCVQLMEIGAEDDWHVTGIRVSVMWERGRAPCYPYNRIQYIIETEKVKISCILLEVLVSVWLWGTLVLVLVVCSAWRRMVLKWRGLTHYTLICGCLVNAPYFAFSHWPLLSAAFSSEACSGDVLYTHPASEIIPLITNPSSYIYIRFTINVYNRKVRFYLYIFVYLSNLCWIFFFFSQKYNFYWPTFFLLYFFVLNFMCCIVCVIVVYRRM